MGLDLDAIRAKWLQVCGACDAGIGECSHPDEDYRPVILDLLTSLTEAREQTARTRAVVQAAKAWASDGPSLDGWRIPASGDHIEALLVAVDALATGGEG